MNASPALSPRPLLRLISGDGASFVREREASLEAAREAAGAAGRAASWSAASAEPGPTTGARIRLRSGLSPRALHAQLVAARRQGDVGERRLAHYLAELHDGRGWQALGCSSLAHYAESVLSMDRRRAHELVQVGVALRSLPRLDNAFRRGRLTWSKILLVVGVATPTHERAWLEKAVALDWRALRLLVRQAKPGEAPREPDKQKGLPATRFPLQLTLDAETQRLLEQVRAKVSDERDEAVTNVALFRSALELLAATEQDGTVPGRRRVKSSLYRVVLRQGDAHADGSSVLSVDLDDGPLPVATLDAPAVKTPEPMRRAVLERDRATCRSCASRQRLQVHHVIFRRNCGPTHPSNLATLCRRCHGLLHDGYLVARGRHAATCVFEAPDQAALDEIARRADEQLAVDPVDEAAPAHVAAAPLSVKSMPTEVDAAWLDRHADGLRQAGGGQLRIEDGFVPPSDSDEPDSPEMCPSARTTLVPGGPDNRALAFDSVRGSDHVVARLHGVAEDAEAFDAPFPHTLFVGPPGTGKTTLSKAVAARAGRRLVQTVGANVTDVHTLVSLLASLKEGDLLFIDEIHAVPRPLLELLYQAMDEQRFPLTFVQGSRSRTVQFVMPPFTLIGATTEEMDVPRALRSRFPVVERLGLYADDVLADIAQTAGEAGHCPLDDAAALELARCAAGTPREVHRLVYLVRADVVAHEGRGRLSEPLNLALVRAALDRLGYDADGFDVDHRRYLDVLAQHRGPVALCRMAALLQLPEATVRLRIEPFLMFRGKVRVGARGRELVR